MKLLNNLFLICILSLSIFPNILAYTEVQYSKDNTTWELAGVTNDNKITLETLDDGIDAKTAYYFRVRHVYTNETSNWEYIAARTKQGGINEMEIAIMFTLIVLFLAGCLATWYFEDGLKMAFLLGTILLIPFILSVLANLATEALMSAAMVDRIWFAYKVSLWLLLAMVLYIMYTITINLPWFHKIEKPKFDTPYTRMKDIKSKDKWNTFRS